MRTEQTLRRHQVRAAVNPTDVTGRWFSSWSHFKKNDPGVSLEGNHETNCLNGCRLEQSATPDLFFIAHDLDLLLKIWRHCSSPPFSKARLRCSRIQGDKASTHCWFRMFFSNHQGPTSDTGWVYLLDPQLHWPQRVNTTSVVANLLSVHGLHWSSYVQSIFPPGNIVQCKSHSVLSSVLAFDRGGVSKDTSLVSFKLKR